MNRKIASIVFILVLTAAAVAFAGAAATAARGAEPQDMVAPVAEASLLSPARLAYTYTTAITVTSGQDFNTSQSETCLTQTPCTLRRVVVQARNV